MYIATRIAYFEDAQDNVLVENGDTIIVYGVAFWSNDGTPVFTISDKDGKTLFIGHTFANAPLLEIQESFIAENGLRVTVEDVNTNSGLTIFYGQSGS